MCLIIVTKTPSKITRAICKSAQENNGDGVGVMWYDVHGKLYTKKWMNVPLKKWWPEWREICQRAEAAGSELAVHWRMATHGKTNEAMCHPYRIQAGDGVVEMMHNGIISGYGKKKPKVNSKQKSLPLGWTLEEDEYSDTYEYARMVESILADGGKRLVSNIAFRNLLGEDITSRNKLVFGFDGNPDKVFYKSNASAGVEYAGHWFSNTYAWDCEALTGGALKDTSWRSMTYGGWNYGNTWSSSNAPETQTVSARQTTVMTYDDVVDADASWFGIPWEDIRCADDDTLYDISEFVYNEVMSLVYVDPERVVDALSTISVFDDVRLERLASTILDNHQRGLEYRGLLQQNASGIAEVLAGIIYE
ncbi:hypothetical protein ACJU26_09140 [Acidithiobacillus sp. M4-SHS-6]|uniref:hypothetical protein n=1 Tax=Acidithiobacillus sp. M4-SHS-6 TaxID=3383024 RepID=UPI0039BEA231